MISLLNLLIFFKETITKWCRRRWSEGAVKNGLTLLADRSVLTNGYVSASNFSYQGALELSFPLPSRGWYSMVLLFFNQVNQPIKIRQSAGLFAYLWVFEHDGGGWSGNKQQAAVTKRTNFTGFWLKSGLCLKFKRPNRPWHHRQMR